ncbi:unnamed protein product [Callosobruchus maculatus]|uniref:Reverse transcriptase domain-containing protein n=1 Tax=Callosobruchus maculatus TaxID=64391 RepID=A0A653DNZ9_CALMS|nr:unnamed protein product [Callosobruchus maculatus]
MYADDTSIISTADSSAECKEHVVDALKILQEWFLLNNLQLNVSKSQIIQFARTTDEINISLNNENINEQPKLLFLGITLDSRLDWSIQTDKLAKQIAKYNYALRVIRRDTGQKAALVAYHGYIQSALSYGVMFWGASCHTDRIMILQKKCIRSIFRLRPRDSCREVFRQNSILTVVACVTKNSKI